MEVPQKCSCLAACARLWRQPCLFGDDTHAVEGTANKGSKDAGRSQRETPDILENKPQDQDHREDEHRGHGQNNTK